MQHLDLLFKTNRFNLSEIREHFINPCCFGDDIAEWFRRQLSARGFAVTEPGQEDWGWYIYVTIENTRYFVGIGGNADEGSIDPNQGEWRLMIEKSRSLRQKLTGTNKILWTDSIFPILEDILRKELGIQNVLRE